MRRFLAGGLALTLLSVGCTHAGGISPGTNNPPPRVVGDLPLVPVDCGKEENGQELAWNQSARDCLVAAAAKGEPAKFTLSYRTTEGDPIIHVIQLLAPGRIQLQRDTRQDKFGDQKVSAYICKSLVQEKNPRATGDRQYLHLAGCSGENPEWWL